MDALDVLPQTPTRDQIERFEGMLMSVEATHGPTVLEAEHNFAESLVARTIFIPAGTCLTGAAHKAEHLNICVGDITVWTEAGMRRLTGYNVIESKPGAKRVGFAHSDTHWTTVHLNVTNERDTAKLEEALVEDAQRLQSRRMALQFAPLEALQ